LRCTGSSPVLRILPMSKPTKSADRQTEPSSSSGSKRNAKPRLPNATVNVWLIRVSFLPYPRVTPSPRYTIRHPASLFLRELVRYSGRVPSRIPKRPHLEYRSPVVRCTALMTWHEGNPALAGTHGALCTGGCRMAAALHLLALYKQRRYIATWLSYLLAISG